jgi:hypothetical protein
MGKGKRWKEVEWISGHDQMRGGSRLVDDEYNADCRDRHLMAVEERFWMLSIPELGVEFQPRHLKRGLWRRNLAVRLRVYG